MANDNLCVFCGQKIGTFRGTSVPCGGVAQPAFCYGCGRYEFYDPKIVRKNPFLAYLIEKDSTSF